MHHATCDGAQARKAKQVDVKDILTFDCVTSKRFDAEARTDLLRNGAKACASASAPIAGTWTWPISVTKKMVSPQKCTKAALEQLSGRWRDLVTDLVIWSADSAMRHKRHAVMPVDLCEVAQRNALQFAGFQNLLTPRSKRQRVDDGRSLLSFALCGEAEGLADGITGPRPEVEYGEA